jgi:hypothetical protein
LDDRLDNDPKPVEALAEAKPVSLADISITDRWAPLVRDPDKKIEPSLKLGQRTLAALVCLIVLALVLWAL